MSLHSRIRNVTAVLGPTNTGKTHLAIERMLGHASGMIGLPLRLLAREVYDKIAARAGANAVALITGEEKIKPEGARYWVSTVEAMPREIETDFLAIDEIQLCADPERGHVFTERMLSARGREETLLLGAATMRETINDLIPGANFISRPRLSKITYSGQKKITRLPKRSAIVAFSAAEVYEIAELIRRQLGGAAVVLGALSPRTRNAQVALYQSGDVEYLVATDAIGMGLNLDVDHVAFAATRKFDGHTHRNLTPSELGQIAGRAGRHMNDGTFGVTGDAQPFDADLIERLETHTFDPVRSIQWRNGNLDFSSLEGLRESLRQAPREVRLQRARMADDQLALETLAADREIASRASNPDSVRLLWDVCQVPDYRKISPQNHAELVATLYGFLMSDQHRIPEDWFSKQVEHAAAAEGDIDTLANRIAHIRTWTFVANRADWLADPVHWQARTRAIEDALSDALHEQLTQRFVDLKTSALMRGLRDKDEMTAEIAADGSVHVEKHFVGRLKGFRFQPDLQADAQGIHGKAARGAAAHVLANEFQMRARRVASAKNDAFRLTRQGRILWRDEEIARLEAGDDPLRPTVVLLADENLTGPDKEKVQQRLDQWVTTTIAERLKPLVELKSAEDVTGLGRGIAFRMVEGLGSLKRETVANEMKQLDQPSRAQLRKYGVRFGAFNIFLPLLLKPAAAELTLTLWSLKNATAFGLNMDELPEPPRAGLTSAAAVATTPDAYYRAAGYHVCGPRAIRLDILERLADLIRPLLAWRPTEAGQTPPKGSSGDGGFIVTSEMMSILGCSSEELGHVLKALGFRLDRRPAPAKPAARQPDAGVDAATAAIAAAVALASPPSDASAVTAAGPGDVTSPASASAGAAVAAGSSASEPEMIDVWRPRRRERGERSHHRQDGAHRHAEGERQSRGPRDRHQQQRDRNRKRRPSGDHAPSSPATPPAIASPAGASVAAQSPTTANADAAPATSLPAAGRDARENRDQRRGERTEQQRSIQQHRERRRDDRRRDDRRPEIRSAGPPRRGPDPDSPFAALAALKSQLEAKGKDRS